MLLLDQGQSLPCSVLGDFRSHGFLSQGHLCILQACFFGREDGCHLAQAILCG